MAISSELEGLLAEWLPRQSWFPVVESELGTEPDITPMSYTLVFELDLPQDAIAADTVTVRGNIVILAVSSGPNLRRLSVPLTFRTAEDEPLRPHLIGRINDFMMGPVWVYDAVADPLFVLFAATAMATGNADFALGAAAGSLADPAGSRTQAGRPGAAPAEGAGGRGAAGAHGAGTSGGGTDPRGTSSLADTVKMDPVAADPVARFNADGAGAFSSAQSAAQPAVGASDGRQLTAAQVGDGGKDFYDLQNMDVLWHRAATTQLQLLPSRAGETAVVIDDHAFPSVVTFFRVLGVARVAAVVPESVRLPVALTEVGSRAVPPVLGWLAGRWFDGHDLRTHSAPLALLTRNEPSSVSAWTDAVETVVGVDQGSIGSYTRRANDLGHRIGELHFDLAAEFGVVDSAGDPTAEWVKKWSERVDWALARAPLALNPLGSKLRAHQRFVRSLQSVGSLQRIHGGLTLNQVTKAPVGGFMVVNFRNEAEPKPPAVDLVALIRSIDYAAGYARLARTGALDPATEPATLGATGLVDDELTAEIKSAPETLWSLQAQNALLSGYSHATDSSFTTADPVLRAVLVDRLLVEVVSELRNRPTWLVVPLAALTALLNDGVEVKSEPNRIQVRTASIARVQRGEAPSEACGEGARREGERSGEADAKSPGDSRSEGPRSGDAEAKAPGEVRSGEADAKAPGEALTGGPAAQVPGSTAEKASAAPQAGATPVSSALPAVPARPEQAPEVPAAAPQARAQESQEPASSASRSELPAQQKPAFAAGDAEDDADLDEDADEPGPFAPKSARNVR